MSVNPTAPYIRPWADNKNLTVINFFGGPGTGKSTTAADVFSLMKKQNFKVELLREIAKDQVWERRHNIFREQDYIFAKQHRLQRRLVGHDIDYCVIDSSLLLAMFYTPEDMPPSFKTFVRDVYDSYNNINIFLVRNPDIPYVQDGRNQDLEGAKALDRGMLQYFQQTNLDYHPIMAGENAAKEVVKLVKKLRDESPMPTAPPGRIIYE